VDFHVRKVLFLAAFVACGKPTGTLEVTTGPETDVFTKDPRPTHIVVEAYAPSGTPTTLGRAQLPGPLTVDLAEQKKEDIVTLRITARDDAEVVRASGSSLLLQLGVLADHTLQIFVQRNGELARMPCVLGDGREDPLLSILAGRYVLVLGGTDASLAPQTQLCDLMSLAAIPFPPKMPIVPMSIAPISIGELLVRDDGAQVFDFSSSTATAVAAPDGGTWAEVAGGPTVQGEGGAQYIVGPARRSGAPTDKILRLSSDGGKAFIRLGQARLGAAATWVSGRGLVVIGGSPMGAGVEEIPAGATTSTPLSAFPSDPHTGAAAALDGSRVVVVRSDGTSVLYDLVCSQTCAPAAYSTDLGMPVVEAHGADADSVVAIGRAMDGSTHVFRLRQGSASEVPLKIARKNARAVRLPTGALAIAGGSATIESFVP
jgi:hypothetical protein